MSKTIKAGESKELLEADDETCYSILLDAGLEVPDTYKDYIYLTDFVSTIAKKVVENPTVTNWYNYEEAQEFALKIRETVLEYIGYEETAVDSSLLTYSLNSTMLSQSQYEYLLRYSTKVFLNSACENYNCYSYALHGGSVYEWFSPGRYIGLTITANELATMSSSRFASLVQYDLQQLGYTNITISTTRPSYQSGYKVIAFRKITDDYHFMWEYGNNVWRHKPGSSAILKYNYTSLTDGRWINEGLYLGNYATEEGIYASWTKEYTGTVYYIKYKLIYS